MQISDLEKLPLMRINVRGLVKYQGRYIFLKRTKFGESRSFLMCPGGRVEPTDRVMIPGKSDLEATLRNALVRQLEADLAATGVVINEFIGISRMHNHSREVLFAAEVAKFNFELRTGIDTIDPNRGEFEIVALNNLSKETLSRKGLMLEPKEWRKLIANFAS